jgi:hypothetical protein
LKRLVWRPAKGEGCNRAKIGRDRLDDPSGPTIQRVSLTVRRFSTDFKHFPHAAVANAEQADGLDTFRHTVPGLWVKGADNG